MKKTFNTEIISIGTELLLGQIVNTNAQWMSEQLAISGINTYYHTVVGDNLTRITNIFRQAHARSDVVIVTGGLGPTEDDLSREAFQKISQIPIIEEPNALRKIELFYKNQNREMTPNNKRQARVFKDSIILTNKLGMAPGNIVVFEDVHWIFLPGVPREMKQMFLDDVIPYLKKLNGEMIIESQVLRFIGIGESSLEYQLKDMIAQQKNPTIAPLAERDGVTIRLTAKAKTKEQALTLIEETKEKILEEVGEYYYGENRDLIQEKIFQLLKARKKDLAVAESLTGGLFADRFVTLEGASTIFKGGVVAYSANVKESVLKVSKETIDKEGTVSKACAIEMAKNVAHLLDASLGISFTGVAGPNQLEGKDVGTVIVSLYDKERDEQFVGEYNLSGDRGLIRHRAVLKGLEILFNYLK